MKENKSISNILESFGFVENIGGVYLLLLDNCAIKLSIDATLGGNYKLQLHINYIGVSRVAVLSVSRNEVGGDSYLWSENQLAGEGGCIADCIENIVFPFVCRCGADKGILEEASGLSLLQEESAHWVEQDEIGRRLYNIYDGCETYKHFTANEFESWCREAILLQLKDEGFLCGGMNRIYRKRGSIHDVIELKRCSFGSHILIWIYIWVPELNNVSSIEYLIEDDLLALNGGMLGSTGIDTGIKNRSSIVAFSNRLETEVEIQRRVGAHAIPWFDKTITRENLLRITSPYYTKMLDQVIGGKRTLKSMILGCD